MDEPEGAEEDFDLEDFEESEDEEEYEEESEDSSLSSDKNEKAENAKNEINTNDIKEDNQISLTANFEEKSDLDENLSDYEFEKVLEIKEKFDINSLLIKNEKINAENIKIKFSHIFKVFCSFMDFKNNYPDFESDFFYFNCLRYMFETYKDLKYKRFINKIQMTEFLNPLTKKIKSG